MESDRSTALNRLIGQFRRRREGSSQVIPTVDAEPFVLDRRSGVIVSTARDPRTRHRPVRHINAHNRDTRRFDQMRDTQWNVYAQFRPQASLEDIADNFIFNDYQLSDRSATVLEEEQVSESLTQQMTSINQEIEQLEAEQLAERLEEMNLENEMNTRREERIRPIPSYSEVMNQGDRVHSSTRN